MRVRIVEFVICPIIAAFVGGIFIVECDHVDDGLRVLLLLLLGDTARLQSLLPFLWQSLK